ncbi:MAG: signal recognition particle receptor subunit alpha, partial [Burkholderiales bacterium]
MMSLIFAMLMLRSARCQPTFPPRVHARPQEQPDQTDAGLWRRLRSGMKKTRDGLTSGLDELFHGPKQIEAGLLDEIESRLLGADVGVHTTAAIVAALAAAVKRGELADRDSLLAVLRAQMLERL